MACVWSCVVVAWFPTQGEPPLYVTSGRVFTLKAWGRAAQGK